MPCIIFMFVFSLRPFLCRYFNLQPTLLDMYGCSLFFYRSVILIKPFRTEQDRITHIKWSLQNIRTKQIWCLLMMVKWAAFLASMLNAHTSCWTILLSLSRSQCNLLTEFKMNHRKIVSFLTRHLSFAFCDSLLRILLTFYVLYSNPHRFIFFLLLFVSFSPFINFGSVGVSVH